MSCLCFREKSILFIAAGSSSAGATAMNSESETDEADMGRLQGKVLC